MIVSIIQPSFLPWLGYFEQIAYADAFVFFDDVQYTRKDWRNRNRLKSPAGVKTVTVPVKHSDRDQTLICEVELAGNQNYPEELLNQVIQWYKKSKYFDQYFPEFKTIVSSPHLKLVDLNADLTRFLMKALSIDVPTYFSSEIPRGEVDRNGRIIEICKAVGADILYDGKAAKSFIDLALFEREGVEIIFQNYQCKMYPQLWGDFEPFLSTLDVLFNCGNESRDILLSSPSPIFKSAEIKA